jgi:hypothetical protein
MRFNDGASCVRAAGPVAVMAVLSFALACGGSGSNSNSSGGGNNNNQVIAGPGPNVVTLTADSGPSALINGYTNGSFVSATICIPGTTTCQTIDHLLVDTGSFGLRLMSSASGGALTLALPQVKDSNNHAIGECVQFIDTSFLWGPVVAADVTMSNETASSVPVHVVGDTTFTGVPPSCSTGGIDRDTLEQLGANGILGVGSVQYDCGSACVSGSAPPTPVYYSCSGSTCTSSFLPLAQQVQNPVALFPTDNNGVIVELPSVPAAGAVSATGALVFGIGTQSNNQLGSASVLSLGLTPANFLDITTTYKGTQYPQSFVDSGSNGLFFLDSNTTGLPLCLSSSFFYCPSSTQNFSATNTGSNNTSTTVSFSIANAEQLSLANWVFNDLGGPNTNSFDWGLPFFLGRNVFVSIQGKTAPGGTTPYVAY